MEPSTENIKTDYLSDIKPELIVNLSINDSQTNYPEKGSGEARSPMDGTLKDASGESGNMKMHTYKPTYNIVPAVERANLLRQNMKASLQKASHENQEHDALPAIRLMNMKDYQVAVLGPRMNQSSHGLTTIHEGQKTTQDDIFSFPQNEIQPQQTQLDRNALPVKQDLWCTGTVVSSDMGDVKTSSKLQTVSKKATAPLELFRSSIMAALDKLIKDSTVFGGKPLAETTALCEKIIDVLPSIELEVSSEHAAKFLTRKAAEGVAGSDPDLVLVLPASTNQTHLSKNGTTYVPSVSRAKSNVQTTAVQTEAEDSSKDIKSQHLQVEDEAGATSTEQNSMVKQTLPTTLQGMDEGLTCLTTSIASSYSSAADQRTKLETTSFKPYSEHGPSSTGGDLSSPSMIDLAALSVPDAAATEDSVIHTMPTCNSPEPVGSTGLETVNSNLAIQGLETSSKFDLIPKPNIIPSGSQRPTSYLNNGQNVLKQVKSTDILPCNASPFKEGSFCSVSNLVDSQAAPVDPGPVFPFVFRCYRNRWPHSDEELVDFSQMYKENALLHEQSTDHRDSSKNAPQEIKKFSCIHDLIGNLTWNFANESHASCHCASSSGYRAGIFGQSKFASNFFPKSKAANEQNASTKSNDAVNQCDGDSIGPNFPNFQAHNRLDGAN